MFNELWYIEYTKQADNNCNQDVRLAGMRKPASDEDVQSLKTNGIVGIISLLDDEENHELYRSNEMDFLWLAVKGGTAPNRQQVEKANEYIQQKLMGSNKTPEQVVATHCNGGRKRTGTLLAGVMVLNGVDPETAINQVETANPEIKLSDAQREFLHSLV